MLLLLLCPDIEWIMSANEKGAYDGSLEAISDNPCGTEPFAITTAVLRTSKAS